MAAAQTAEQDQSRQAKRRKPGDAAMTGNGHVWNWITIQISDQA
jgi:hypothetical protein